MLAVARQSKKGGGWMLMKVSAEEWASSTMEAETIAQAVNQIRLNGYVILENVLPVELIDELYASFRSVYQKLYDIDPDNTEVNTSEFRKNRARMNMPFEKPFADPRVIASSFVVPIFEQLLGKDMIFTYAAVDAPLPGSDYQVAHSDAPPFYPELAINLPPAGLALNIPLVDITEQNGPTEIWPGGTHLTPEMYIKPEYIIETSKLNKPIKVLLPKGSILLRDLRIWHRGTPNNSDSIRPLMTLIYARPWWRGHYQETLAIKKDVYETLSDRAKEMVRFEKLLEPSDEMVIGGTRRRTEQFYKEADKVNIFKK
jgi:ectoine hydroxylase-related dioxygenase (phytanoyl-CoA dioxygenase family)